MMESEPCDLRLVSDWHGEEAGGTPHFSLYNSGSNGVAVGELHLTGGFWLTAAAVLC